MSVFWLEGEFPIQCPPKAGEQESQQDARNRKGCANAIAELHGTPPVWQRHDRIRSRSATKEPALRQPLIEAPTLATYKFVLAQHLHGRLPSGLRFLPV